MVDEQDRRAKDERGDDGGVQVVTILNIGAAITMATSRCACLRVRMLSDCLEWKHAHTHAHLEI